MRAPTGRRTRVKVMANVAVTMVIPKSLAKFVRQKTRTKKSNESRVQLPTPAKRVLRWEDVHASLARTDVVMDTRPSIEGEP